MIMKMDRALMWIYVNIICQFYFFVKHFCLIASYITIPAETEAFKDVIFPFIGIFTRKSQFSFTSLLIPNPSLPIIIAIGPFKS